MNRWLLLQLSDSAFPVGGFAHSAGLEAAVQLGEVGSRRALSGFVASALWQVGLGALPFVRAGFERPNDLCAIDDICDAFLSNHVANRASRTQGRAFAATSARVFPSPEVQRLDAAVRARELLGHHAPLFGAALRALSARAGGTPEAPEEAQSIYLHTALRGVLSAAVRLGLVGPMEAQRMQLESGPLLDRVLDACKGLGLGDAAQPAPLLDVFGATQDALYSRLFQS